MNYNSGSIEIGYLKFIVLMSISYIARYISSINIKSIRGGMLWRKELEENVLVLFTGIL